MMSCVNDITSFERTYRINKDAHKKRKVSSVLHLDCNYRNPSPCKNHITMTDSSPQTLAKELKELKAMRVKVDTIFKLQARISKLNKQLKMAKMMDAVYQEAQLGIPSRSRGSSNSSLNTSFRRQANDSMTDASSPPVDF